MFYDYWVEEGPAGPSCANQTLYTRATTNKKMALEYKSIYLSSVSPSNDNGEKNKKKTGRLVVLEMLFDSFFFLVGILREREIDKGPQRRTPPKKKF